MTHEITSKSINLNLINDTWEVIIRKQAPGTFELFVYQKQQAARKKYNSIVMPPPEQYNYLVKK